MNNSQNNKLYKKIINNRFKISFIMICVLTIIGFFINKTELQNAFFITDKAFCLWWNIKFFALCLISYELFFIITNKNEKLALGGTIILALSGTIQWNLNNIDALIIGEFITVLVQKFFEKDKFKSQVLISSLITIFSIIYVWTFRPYAVAFGYLFLALIIWIILENKDKLKDNKILGLVTCVLSILGMIISALFFNNHNIEYYDLEMSGVSVLFSYLYSPLLPFFDFKGQELVSGIISIFPVPIIMSLYYIYTKEKHICFLLPITIVTVLEIVFCMSGFPNFINNITLFSEVSAIRAVSCVQIANLFIMFYFLGNIKEELFKIKYAMRITIVIVCLLVFVRFPVYFSNKQFLYMFVCELSLLSFLLLNFSDKKYQKVLMFFLILITLISGVPVNLLI